MASKKPPVELSTGEAIQDVLRVFRTLDPVVRVAGESDLHLLLEAEKAGKGRRIFLQRVYGRLSRLRAKRETEELKAAIKDA